MSETMIFEELDALAFAHAPTGKLPVSSTQLQCLLQAVHEERLSAARLHPPAEGFWRYRGLILWHTEKQCPWTLEELGA